MACSVLIEYRSAKMLYVAYLLETTETTGRLCISVRKPSRAASKYAAKPIANVEHFHFRDKVIVHPF